MKQLEEHSSQRLSNNLETEGLEDEERRKRERKAKKVLNNCIL